MAKQVLTQELLPVLQGAGTLVTDDLAVRILMQLAQGVARYSDLRFKTSSKTLVARLKRLERHGLVTRTLHPEVPPRVEYAITEKGVELLSILQGLVQWERS